jgi:DNA-binding response OmpR family regulator
MEAIPTAWQPAPRVRGHRVLVIEDDRDMREALVEVLQLEGYEVEAAGNGADGLALARSHRPDVILLDLMMPIMSGWEFRAAQLKDARLAQVPVIVMSAYHSDLDVVESIPKPFHLDDMIAAIRRHAE